MSNIYVAGPVYRSEKDERFPGTAWYDAIEKLLTDMGLGVSIPRSNAEGDSWSECVLYGYIYTEIWRSAVVVSFLSPGDMSVPVESTIAAINGKRQIIIVPTGMHLPRMIKGLPEIVEIIEVADQSTVDENIVAAIGNAVRNVLASVKSAAE